MTHTDRMKTGRTLKTRERLEGRRRRAFGCSVGWGSWLQGQKALQKVEDTGMLTRVLACSPPAQLTQTLECAFGRRATDAVSGFCFPAPPEFCLLVFPPLLRAPGHPEPLTAL